MSLSRPEVHPVQSPNVLSPLFTAKMGSVSLGDAVVGMTGIITAVGTTSLLLREKLFSMGIVPGTFIRVKSFAPWGDPIIIEALGYLLSLRRSEAEGIYFKDSESTSVDVNNP